MLYDLQCHSDSNFCVCYSPLALLLFLLTKCLFILYWSKMATTSTYNKAFKCRYSLSLKASILITSSISLFWNTKKIWMTVYPLNEFSNLINHSLWFVLVILFYKIFETHYIIFTINKYFSAVVDGNTGMASGQLSVKVRGVHSENEKN